FDSLKSADVLTPDLDLGEKGLHLAGVLNVKAGSEVAKPIATIQTSDAASLARLPADAMAYVYMNLDSKTFHRLQGMSMSILNPENKTTPALDKAMADLDRLRPLNTTRAAPLPARL